MTTTDENSTPVGLYILGLLMIVPALEVIYTTITTNNFIYIAVILVPFFTYIGIGIINRWPKAKDLFMVVAVLLFLGAIPDLVMELLFEKEIAIPNAITIAENTAQFSIFPVAYFYFKRENVKSYFEPAS